MSKRIALTGEEYNNYLKDQGITIPGPNDAFSTAANYREFLGTGRDVICDEALTDLGITAETIAACVPEFKAK